MPLSTLFLILYEAFLLPFERRMFPFIIEIEEPLLSKYLNPLLANVSPTFESPTFNLFPNDKILTSYSSFPILEIISKVKKKVF